MSDRFTTLNKNSHFLENYENQTHVAVAEEAWGADTADDFETVVTGSN